MASNSTPPNVSPWFNSLGYAATAHPSCEFFRGISTVLGRRQQGFKWHFDTEAQNNIERVGFKTRQGRGRGTEKK